MALAIFIKTARPVAALPLVTQGTQTVIVGQRVLRRQRLALRHRAADRHRPGGQVIDIGHFTRRRRGHGFRRAIVIGVAHLNLHGLADIRIAQRVGGLGGIRNIIKTARPVAALPLVTQGTQTVIVGQRVLRCQRLALRHRAADRHRPGGQVIDIGHFTRRRRGHGFRRAIVIGVAHLNPHGLADIRIAQRVGPGGRIRRYSSKPPLDPSLRCHW